jgi:paraquat-inducible protein B
VIVNLYPAMFGADVLETSTADGAAGHRKRMDALTAHGLRAQLRSGSLLTGALYVDFDFFPDAAPATIDWSGDPVQLPAIPGEFEAIEASLGNIVKKIDKLPIQKIGTDLAKALAQLDRTLGAAETTMTSATKTIEPNSALLVDVNGALQEVSRAARAVRDFADYLERHPEALLRGKSGGTD